MAGRAQGPSLDAIPDGDRDTDMRVLRVRGKGTKVVLIRLPPAVGRVIDCAIGIRICGPSLLNSRGARMGHQTATLATWCWRA